MFSPRSGWVSAMGACFPSGCAVCGRWPAPPSGSPVCNDCTHAFASSAPRCPRCALVLPTDLNGCTACASDPSPLATCFAAVDYAYPWQGLIHRFKFASQPAWAHWFADMLWHQSALRQLASSCDWWLPIPLTSHRLGERGYNQAWELTKALHRQALRTTPTHGAMPHVPRHDVLLKLADTSDQHALNRSARLANLRAAYCVNPSAADTLPGKSVLLVDDVMTTGATLHAAARTLLQAGAAQVSAVVFARTPPPDVDSAE